MRGRWSSCLLLLLPLTFALPSGAAPLPISVCIDPEPPPWSYWQRGKDGKPTKELTGFSVDLVRHLFRTVGRDAQFMINVPWERCKRDVRLRKTGFIMDFYQDGSQAGNYLYSTHYNTLTPQLFTRRDHPFEAESAADLRRHKGCGFVGGAYSHYGLKDEELDLSANGYAGVVQKLKSGYCDFFVEELEILSGLQMGHEDYLSDPDIVHRPLKWVKRPGLHLATSPDGPDAALIPRLNAEIERMDKSGELAALWRKYAGDLPFNR